MFQFGSLDRLVDRCCCSTRRIRDEEIEFDRFFPSVEILLFVETTEQRSIFDENHFVVQALERSFADHFDVTVVQQTSIRSCADGEDFHPVRPTMKGDDCSSTSPIAARRFSPRSQSIEQFVAFQRHWLTELLRRLFIFERPFHFFIRQLPSNISLRLLIENTSDLKRRGEKDHRRAGRRTSNFQ